MHENFIVGMHKAILENEILCTTAHILHNRGGQQVGRSPSLSWSIAPDFALN